MSKLSFVLNPHDIAYDVFSKNNRIPASCFLGETNTPGGRNGFRSHEFADRFEHHAELLVVFLLEFVVTPGEIGVGSEHDVEVLQKLS